MKNQKSKVYILFHHHGQVSEFNESEFKRLSAELSDQWEEEEGDLGRWYLPVLSDEFIQASFRDETISFNKEVQEGNSLGWAINQKVSSILNDEIIGPCFLNVNESKLGEVKNKFSI